MQGIAETDAYRAARDRREVFRIVDLSAADLAAILDGEMNAKFDYLNAELD